MLKTVSTYVDVDVDIDLSDFDTEELIEEVENRGLQIFDKEDSGAMSDSMKDEIYNLYRDYIDGKDFERNLKMFFENNLDIVVK